MVRVEGAAPVMAGDGNWMPVGTTGMPGAWKGVEGTDPGFVDVADGDYRPAAGSPLIGSGVLPPGGVRARWAPPVRSAGVGVARALEREKDIGAFLFGAGT